MRMYCICNRYYPKKLTVGKWYETVANPYDNCILNDVGELQAATNDGIRFINEAEYLRRHRKVRRIV